MSRQWTKSKKFPGTTPENNMSSTSEKCPEMTQSMLREMGTDQKYWKEISSFPEICDLLSFQHAKSNGFSSVLTKKRSKNQPKGPKYNVIRKYLKSKS